MEDYIEISEAFINDKLSKVFKGDRSISIINTEQYFWQSFKAQLETNNNTIEPLYFKTGALKLTVGKDLFNKAFHASLLSSVLYFNDHKQFGSTILTAILTSIISFELMEIKDEEEVVYMRLPIKNAYMTVQEHFDSLPEYIRKNVNELQFEIFMNKFVKAGLAKRDLNGEERYLVLSKGRFCFKFDFFV
ncbi:hypothetical protein AM493_08870 [Flavobacterium akiainvivens]|uniref:Uncharacterized protein n=1 Tax=Flavobacterium akiainvivens TaxID=1202724 RepID=A0A0M8MH53_9FLAO|nr:hypothetical protein [Flavobacterium akiainvivens]KOS06131.1 hypothetical protein AM493_08870 [Flavobacterium akiainvivens]SFQ67735.1 hypothetical protein SAMN05444144_1147 [Flavobacterium akiainvivens]